MSTVRMTLIALLVVLVSALALPPARADAECVVTASWPSAGTVYTTIVGALNAAPAFVNGAVVTVSGECTETSPIYILEKFANFTLRGPDEKTTPPATVVAQGGDSAITIRGQSITIWNLRLVSGAPNVVEGITVYRGGQAQIGYNTIEGFPSVGISVSQSSYARIFKNIIQDNTGDGITAADGSVVRVGFISNSDAIAPNTIQNNGGAGIRLHRMATGRIYGNTITGNGSFGVYVDAQSYGDIAWNDISGNTGGAVRVRTNSAVQLGKTTGRTDWDYPNTTTTLNTGYGVECSIGGAVEGDLGTLRGTKGVKQIRTGCEIVEW
jgi:parallel beta-helix repeat protein